MGELDKLLGGGGGGVEEGGLRRGGTFEEFSMLNNFNRTGFILGYENWNRYDF